MGSRTSDLRRGAASTARRPARVAGADGRSEKVPPGHTCRQRARAGTIRVRRRLLVARRSPGFLQATSGNTHTTLDTSVAALAELQGKLREVEKQVMSTNRELVTVREEAKEVFRVRKSLLDNIAANQEAMKLAVSEIGTADAHIARLQTELQDLLSATSIDARRRSSVSRRRRSSLFQAAALAHMA